MKDVLDKQRKADEDHAKKNTQWNKEIKELND